MDISEPRFPIRQLMGPLSVALRGVDAVTPAGLAWRTKQVQRQDWPTTLGQDPNIKRGYTPRQALRLLCALSLLDAGLGPTQAVAAASDNENTLLAIIRCAIGPRPLSGAQRVLAMIRPRLLDGPVAQDSPEDGVIIEPITADEIGDHMAGAIPGPAWLIVDIASQAKAVLDGLPIENDAVEAFSAVAEQGLRATLAGDGYRRTKLARGDRYRSRR